MVTLEWTNNERGGREGSGRAKVGMDRERERERERKEEVTKSQDVNYLWTWAVWPVKSRYKLPKDDTTRKMKYFDIFTKIAFKYGRIGQNNYNHRLWKVASSAINRPIWSEYEQMLYKNNKTMIGCDKFWPKECILSGCWIMEDKNKECIDLTILR